MAKYLILTGGSRGIGEKTIAYFLDHGWQAINISRTACKLTGVMNVNLDLSQADKIAKHTPLLANAVKDATLISLVHNAAYYKRDSVTSLSLENLRLTLETNLLSNVALNNIFLPLMQPGSSIIYIGSTLSEKAVPECASYTISKHAGIGLMKATCQDLIGKDIHTCCICPGLVDTQLLKETMSEELINKLIDTKIIAHRLIKPDEIAEIIYFCANSAVINGAVIHANLGQVAD